MQRAILRLLAVLGVCGTFLFSQPLTQYKVKIRFGALDTTCYPSCAHPSEWRLILYADIYDSSGNLVPSSTQYNYSWGVDFCRGIGLQFGWISGPGLDYISPDGNKQKTEPGCCISCPFQSYYVAVRVMIVDEYFYSDTIRIPNIPIPSDFGLSQNYPNPFNGYTRIWYQVPQLSHVDLVVYDLDGRKIEELVNENQQVGYRYADFNSKAYSSGIYFYRLTIRQNQTMLFTESRKMLLIK